MKNILLQLYNGEISPSEQFQPKIEEYKNIHEKNYCHYENFIKKLEKLEPPLHEEFIKIMDEQLDSLSLEISEMFINGFCLGAKMMIEILDTDNCN